jgi:hypothetical protein
MRILTSEFCTTKAYKRLAVARLGFAQVRVPRGVPNLFYVALESINRHSLISLTYRLYVVYLLKLRHKGTRKTSWIMFKNRKAKIFYKIFFEMASWQNSSGKENHKSLFENVSHDRCIFCGSDREEIARTDFTIMFSEFEYSTGSICKSCYHANAKQVKAV